MYALDLTPVFDQLLKSKEGAPTRKPRFDAAQTEGFLKEAYRIVRPALYFVGCSKPHP